MFQPSKLIKISMVIVIGIILQILLITTDDMNSPDRVTQLFAKSYFSLDKAGMTKHLCSTLTEDNNVVDQYIQSIEKEAKDTGFKLYARSIIYHVKTHIISLNDSEARVSISGKQRHSLNPLYTMVAIIFGLGEVYPFEETIDLINENGLWKVCGNPFPLTG